MQEPRQDFCYPHYPVSKGARFRADFGISATPIVFHFGAGNSKRKKFGLLARLGTLANEPYGNICAKIDDNLKNRTRLTGWLNKNPEK